MAIRGLMGVAEGSFCPTSFAATADASHPRRRGLNLGLQQSGFALFSALSPIIATQLLGFVSWRWVFALVAVPGLILGAIMLFVIRAEGHEGRRVGMRRRRSAMCSRAATSSWRWPPCAAR